MYKYMYNGPTRYTWDEDKRRRTLTARGLDFADAPRVLEGPTFTLEDDRVDYGEARWVSIGVLDAKIVVIVHTETETEVRVFSMREATKNERELFFRYLSGSG